MVVLQPSVRNDGYLPLTIVAAGRSTAGLALTSVEGRFPVTLAGGEETTFKLTYQVTDCEAVTSDPWPVPVTIARPWGGQTILLTLPTRRQSDWRGSDLPSFPVTRDGPVEWQRIQTDLACALRG